MGNPNGSSCPAPAAAGLLPAQIMNPPKARLLQVPEQLPIQVPDKGASSARAAAATSSHTVSSVLLLTAFFPLSIKRDFKVFLQIKSTIAMPSPQKGSGLLVHSPGDGRERGRASPHTAATNDPFTSSALAPSTPPSRHQTPVYGPAHRQVRHSVTQTRYHNLLVGDPRCGRPPGSNGRGKDNSKTVYRRVVVGSTSQGGLS